MADYKEVPWQWVECIIGALLGVLLSGLFVSWSTRYDVHHELCPTILALSPTAADSLAVFQEHEGCFEFVQSEVGNG